MAIIFFTHFSFVLLSLIIPLVSSDADHWSYTSQNEWPKLCKTGVRQSPVDINTKTVLVNTSLNIDLKHYEIDFHNFKITNNGHTAELSIDLTGDDVKQPLITGRALDNNEYVMAQLHFHWSDHKGRGSEHAFSGVHYSMEMHIVHYNKKYDNISEAGTHPDGLAVLGVMFEITRKANPHLDAIIEGVKAVKVEGGDDYHSTPPQYRQNAGQPLVNLENLLPNDLKLFFRYKGSLTTPPCAESVTWLVFHDTTDIGLKQIKAFRELTDSHKVVLSDTFRQLQALNDRRVEASQPVRDGTTGAATYGTSHSIVTQLSLIITSLLILAKY